MTFWRNFFSRIEISKEKRIFHSHFEKGDVFIPILRHMTLTVVLKSQHGGQTEVRLYCTFQRCGIGCSLRVFWGHITLRMDVMARDCLYQSNNQEIVASGQVNRAASALASRNVQSLVHVWPFGVSCFDFNCRGASYDLIRHIYKTYFTTNCWLYVKCDNIWVLQSAHLCQASIQLHVKPCFDTNV